MEAEDAFHHASRAPATIRVINALMRLVQGGEVWGGPPTTSNSSVPNIKRHQQPLQVKLRINGSGYRRLPEPTVAPEELCLYQVIVKIVQVIIV